MNLIDFVIKKQIKYKTTSKQNEKKLNEKYSVSRQRN